MHIKHDLLAQAPQSDGARETGAGGMETIAILACADHIELLEKLLDEGNVLTWSVLPALQSRRQGFLQHVPRRHPDQCRLVLGFGGKPEIQGSVRAILKARDAGQLCAECTVFIWPAQQAFQGDLHLDPVCDEVVGANRALLLEVAGETFHFCSPECRDEYQQHPDLYRERRKTPYQVGRREIPAAL